MNVDFHSHSRLSDGQFEPAQLLDYFEQRGVGLISVTDHNSLDSWPMVRDLAAKRKIALVPGIELNVQFQGKGLHLLAYAFQPDDRELAKLIRDFQARQREKIAITVKKMASDGFQIDLRAVQSTGGIFLNLHHLFLALSKKPKNREKILADLGKAPTIFQAIDFYFHGGRYRFDWQYLDYFQVEKIIHRTGGLIVLAHPGFDLGFASDQTIAGLKKAGLDGLEVYSPHHDREVEEHYLELVKRLDLLITGGSDFHGHVKMEGMRFERPPTYQKISQRLVSDFVRKVT